MSEYKITLTGIPPSKKNSKIIVCRGKRPLLIPSEAYRNWHEEKSWELTQFNLPKNIEICSIEAIFYPDTKRSADLSNKFESLADLLVDNEILKDDNWFVVKDIHLRVGEIDKENPRTEIKIIIN